MSQCSQDEWRDKMNEEMFREMLFHENGVLEILSAKDDNEKQIADIQSFIDRNFDIIIVAPNEAEAFTPIITKAFQAGIPVIIFDRRILNDAYTAYIDLDNHGIGLAASEYANSLLGDKNSKVLEITGLAASSPAQERHAGFMEGLKEYPKIKLVESIPGDWEREVAYHLMDSLIEVYPDLDLIYAHNDFMAMGVDSLLRKKGRRDIKILGTDASPGQGIPAVKEGKIDATFIYPTEGHRIIRTAFNILEGNPYDSVVHIPALTSVDNSNADILLRQYELLRDETNKVLLLDEIKVNLESKNKTQTRFLRAVISLAIVLGVVLIGIIIMFLRNRKLQKELMVQNKFLEDLLLEKSSKPSPSSLSLPKQDEDEILHPYEEPGDHSVSLEIENSFYNKFLDIIRTQYADKDLNTEKMAQQLNLGAAQFTRKIKALTQNSPIEILRNYRLEKARKLLLTTDKNVNEITYSVGFSSAAYLTKCFREHFGSTPSELRSRN